jgi:hypothetical protein
MVCIGYLNIPKLENEEELSAFGIETDMGAGMGRRVVFEEEEKSPGTTRREVDGYERDALTCFVCKNPGKPGFFVAGISPGNRPAALWVRPKTWRPNLERKAEYPQGSLTSGK